ncbi:hypothetical protein OQ496_12800 [Acetobacter suratthaniensis]|uniref:Uncharacterized protein n=1 Tax=Acetobacter suratthaniensis TaxID=1502841 RepID=A0ABS3LPD3_9PROT|nr:hypothetical protein [Acetobacter suratthaniensis]MBO1329225.1 hypothetical protein [Acetobacter suratthaniensis]MCX2567331.1 hypothetical protein [Acetobacter suratthaniensis]
MARRGGYGVRPRTLWLRAGRFGLLAPALWLACLAPPGRAETADDDAGIVFSEDALQDAQNTGATAAPSPTASPSGTEAAGSIPQGEAPEAEGRMFQSPGLQRLQYRSPAVSDPLSAPDDAAPAPAPSYPAVEEGGAVEGQPSRVEEAAQPTSPPDETVAPAPQAEQARAVPPVRPEEQEEPAKAAARPPVPSVVLAPPLLSTPLAGADTPVAPPPVLHPAVVVQDTGRTLILPGDAQTALAAFRSGSDLVLVVDRPLALPVSGATGAWAAMQVVALEGVTVIRLKWPAASVLPPGADQATTGAQPPLGFVHDSTGWRVCLGGGCPAVSGPDSAGPVVADGATGPRLLRLPGAVLFTGVGRGPVLPLPDPATGGTVFVALSARLTGPVPQGAVAVGYRVRPSWQGLAVMADSSRVSLRATEYGPVVESTAPVPLPVGLVPGSTAGVRAGTLHGGAAQGRDWAWLGLRDEPAAQLARRWQAAQAALKASGWAADPGKASTRSRKHATKTGRPAHGHAGGRHGTHSAEAGQKAVQVAWPVRVAAARAAFAAGDVRQSWLLLRDLPSSSALGGVPDGVSVPGAGRSAPTLPTPHAGGDTRDSVTVLRACAALLAGVPSEAGALADADLRFGPDMALWRAVYEMITGADSGQTATLLARSYARLSQYPAPVRDRLLPRVAAYVARYGAPEVLDTLRAALRDAPPDNSALALPRALLDVRQGQTDAAFALLDRLRAGTGQSAVWAGVEQLALQLAQERISPAEAVRAYERLLAPERIPAGAAGMAARLGYARALVQAGRAGAAASVLSGVRAGEATPHDRLGAVWCDVLYGLVFGVVPQGSSGQAAPPMPEGYVPTDEALARVAALRHWLGYDASTAKLLAGYGAALMHAGRPAQAVPVLAQAEFLSTTPATRADRAELLARAALEAGQEHAAAQALARAALSGFSLGVPADFAADLPERLRYDNALMAQASGQAAQALRLLANDESDDGLRLRGRVYEGQHQWAQAVLVLGRLASRALPAQGAFTSDQVALARRLAHDAAAAGDTDTLNRLRAWVGKRATLSDGF